MGYTKRYGRFNFAVQSCFIRASNFYTNSNVVVYAVLFFSILVGVRRCYRKAFVHLPDDVLLLVLQYLSVKDLYKMRLVRHLF
jgi:hypothetical protein